MTDGRIADIYEDFQAYQEHLWEQQYTESKVRELEDEAHGREGE